MIGSQSDLNGIVFDDIEGRLNEKRILWRSRAVDIVVVITRCGYNQLN